MHIILSRQLPERYLREIKRYFDGAKPIPLPCSKSVYMSISSHPDIFLCMPAPDTMVYSNDLPKATLNSIARSKIKLIASEGYPRGKYPGTCVLNAARVGNIIFHNSKFTDPAIKTVANDMDVKLVHVNQGYTRCSIVAVSDKALITSDRNIARKAVQNGIDSLLIAPGHVTLPGHDTGFIGGACGVIRDREILFVGDIALHPDCANISSFFEKHNARFTCLAGLPLFDCGSVIFI